MRKQLNSKGFTMVELLIVLIIVAVLAAVATPIYLANLRRARASEAVGAMGLIRQAMRDYDLNTGTAFDVAVAATGNIQNGLPTSVNTTTMAPTPATAGVDVDMGVSQYFSNAAFSVDAAPVAATYPNFATPSAVDFVINVDGGATVDCNDAAAAQDNCAIKGTEVRLPAGSEYRLQMDNSGRVFVSYDDGTTWSAY